MILVLKLEDLFVSPEYRGLGLGKAFFGELGKIAQDKVTTTLHTRGVTDDVVALTRSSPPNPYHRRIAIV